MLSHKYALNILRDQLKELEEQKAKILLILIKLKRQLNH